MLKPPAIDVRQVRACDARLCADLADLLIECVESGASVGFMRPMTRPKAIAFWEQVTAGVTSGERALFVAQDTDGHIVGTVQLVLATPENQPHRADIAKMLVRPSARRQGVGAALLQAAESAALRVGRVLLVLDTANDTAARLYARCGWRAVGTIPNFALWPDGGYCDTVVFYKQLGA